MRGALSILHHQMAPSRIIPADAGSTEEADYELSDIGDHPRGCGEHWVWCFCFVLFGGSSPRMRGALHRLWLPMRAARIIPADAGSTYYRVVR